METYQRYYSQYIQKSYFEKEQFDKIFKVNNNCFTRVLEIGAGCGRTISMYYDRFDKIDLVEPDDKMRNALIQHIKDLKFDKKCQVHESNSLKLPFPDETFDVVTIPFVGISEMSPFHITLSEIFRVLKKDGIFYFLAFNPESDEVINCVENSYLVARSNYDFENRWISIDTLKAPHLGEFGFEINVNIRGCDTYNNFRVQQWSPSVTIWQNLFKTIGFEILHLWGWFSTNIFDSTKDRFVTFVLKKDQISTKDILEKFYDQMSAKYEAICKGDHYRVPLWLRENFSLLSRTYYPRWLDIGCGSGIVGDLIKELHIETSTLDGFDISEQMLIECQKKGIYNHLGKCDLNLGIFEVKPRMYDIVSAIGVLEFVKDINSLIKSIKNILEIDGFFYFTFEKLENEPIIPNHFTFNNEKILRNQYTSDQIIKLFTSFSFEVLKIEEIQAYLSPSLNKHVNYYVGVAKRIK